MLSRTHVTRVLRRTVPVACLVASTLAFPIFAVSAQEADEELTFEQKIIDRLLGGGGDQGIDYRERSPLVIPPSAASLPPPVKESSAAKAANWPKDPNATPAARSGNKTAVRRGAIDQAYESARALRPDELNQGRVAGAGRVVEPAASDNPDFNGKPLMPSQLNQGGEGKQLHNIFGFGGSDKTAATASAEPPSRTRLTEPPTAYRTPTTNQPYAPPKDDGKSWFSKLNPWDRGTCEQSQC